MIAWFARNGVATNFLMGMILIGGFFSMRNLNMQLFPEFEPQNIAIWVAYPGGAPNEVEEAVCIPIEDSVWDLTGIKEMEAGAGESGGWVMIEVDRGKDVRELADEVKARVDAITTFPKDVEKPFIWVLAPKFQVMDVVIHGDCDEKSLHFLANRVWDDLTAIPGITQIEISGVRHPQIDIEVSERALREHGLSFEQVATALRRSSVDIPGGVAETPSGDTLIRTIGKARKGSEFEEIDLLASDNGGHVPLREIAKVKDDFGVEKLYTKFEGKPAITLRIFRAGNQSTLDISDKVKDYVKTKRLGLPDGVDMTIWQDSSFYLRGRLNMMLENAGWGLVLVFCVLALFLRPSLAIWVAIGIPVSFMGAFMVMGVMGTSINLVSLFAFIVVLGILVDDAIVVGESVYSHGRKGATSLQASITGTHAVAMPVTFGVLTSIVAIAPMLFLPGWLGELMKDIPLVVMPVLAFSLIESKLILPYHLSLCRFDKPAGNFLTRAQERVAEGLERFIEKIYSPILDKCLARRYLTLSIFAGILAITIGLLRGGHVPSVKGVAEVPSDHIRLSIVMHDGLPAETTEKNLLKMEEARLAVVEYLTSRGEPNPFRHSVMAMGYHPSPGANPKGQLWGEDQHPRLAAISTELVKSENRTRSAPEISALWRERLGILPEVEEINFQDVAAGGKSSSGPKVDITGIDLDKMAAAAIEIEEKLSEFEGLYDISSHQTSGKRELQLKLKPEGRALGLTQADLGRQVRQAYYGEEIQRIPRDHTEVQVMLRYPLEDRRSLTSLASLRIRAPGGIEAPLEEVAETTFGPGPEDISRKDRLRIESVWSRCNKEVVDRGAIEEKLISNFLPGLKERYPHLRFDFSGERKEQEETDDSLLQATYVALFVIFGLLAIPFRSYIQPLLVMSVIPFGLIGSVLGHLMCGVTMSQLSIFGLVALTGVVINDSLVLVHWVNSRRAEGMPLTIAARKAGSARFRPILLTSLTTFVGLLPVLFERSLQAQFLKPMAISIGFGVLFATFITLLLVPCLYLILNDITGLSDKIFRKSEKGLG